MTDDVDHGLLAARGALLLSIRQAGVHDLDILRAFESAPREEFAPYRFRDLANRDIALPIGCGQTMPRPVELARRIAALGVGRGHRVLEIGVGSGYAAAILARLAREVVSLERYATLAIEAARRLEALGVGNVRVLQGDGMAPDRDLGGFDRIMVHGAILQVPEPLTDRLAPGGALLFARMEPGGEKKGAQRLIRLERNAAGAFLTRDMGPCRLVPLHAEVAQAL